nr:hypothetical protein [Tanacetum cinerariifolium]
MLAICTLDKPVVFKAPKTSLRAVSVSQGAKPRAKTGHKKLATSSKQPFVSSKEVTIGGSSKAPIGSKTGHSKRKKESSLAMDLNPNRTSVSTHVDTEMYKEDQQATGGLTFLGVTSEERANPQLSSGMLALNLNKPLFSAYFIIHSESALGHDVSIDFIAEADPRLSAPNDSISPQQGMDEGTNNTLYDHICTGTDPYVLADQTKSVSEGLETVLTQPTIEKEASSIAIHEEFLSLPSKVESAQDKLKTLDALPSLLLNVTKALNKFTEVLESSSTKAGDQSIPSTGQTDTMPGKGQKDINQATISQLFQRRADKIDEA